MLNDLFKISIYNKHLKLDQKKILSYCNHLRDKDPKGRLFSNQGGWQSELLTGKHPNLNGLAVEILKHAKDYCKLLQIKPTKKLENIWININGYKDYNDYHDHPGAILSGVYYVKNSSNSNILFYSPYTQIIKSYWLDYILHYNHNTSSLFKHFSREGELILFPSWLMHSVEPNMKKENRVSISFNLI